MFTTEAPQEIQGYGGLIKIKADLIKRSASLFKSIPLIEMLLSAKYCPPYINLEGAVFKFFTAIVGKVAHSHNVSNTAIKS
jgi:hypothetical protein